MLTLVRAHRRAAPLRPIGAMLGGSGFQGRGACAPGPRGAFAGAAARRPTRRFPVASSDSASPGAGALPARGALGWWGRKAAAAGAGEGASASAVARVRGVTTTAGAAVRAG